MKTKRAFLHNVRDIRVEEVEIKTGDDEIMIKVASCGLCSWELNFWRGLSRTDDYPYPLGHEFAGTVVEVGCNVSGFKVGDKVACLTGAELNGFSEYTVCNAEYAFLLADSVDPRYALGEPLKCIATVLGAANPKPGDYGVVCGCGPMGQWCTQLLAGSSLAGLIAIDIDDRKLELATSFGATAVINPAKENAVGKLREITKGHLGDFVIEGTGNPAVLNQAQDYLKNSGRGRLILMSSHEETCKEFDFRKLISKGAEIHAPHPAYSHDGLDDMRRAMELLNRGAIQVKPLITHEFPLSDIANAFATLENRPDGYLKGIVYPD